MIVKNNVIVTYEIALRSIKQGNWCLLGVPKHLKDYNLYLLAHNSHKGGIEHTNSKYRDIFRNSTLHLLINML